MLGWYRRQASALAAALLVAFMALGVANAAPHHDDCHDSLCVTSVAAHNAADHRVEGPPQPDEHPLHCVLCHCIRAFKPAAVSAHREAPSIPDDAIVHAPFIGTPASFPAAQPPLRSPPASPALRSV
jgi:hypothetical protein